MCVCGESEQRSATLCICQCLTLKKKIQQIHTSYACSGPAQACAEIGTVVISRMSFGRSSGNSLQSQTKLGDSVEHAWDEHSFVGVSARYGCRCHVPKPIGVVILTCARAENLTKLWTSAPGGVSFCKAHHREHC